MAMHAARHPRQTERLAALQRYDILDTPRESEFDDIVALVAQVCRTPVAVLNFIDADRQWFKAEVGLGVRSTPLETSLCSHVILENDLVEIPDTLADPRMCDNPLCIADGGFRFYAGALLKSPDGLPLGTLCILDVVPRTLSDLERLTLRTLADRVMSELDLRLALRTQDLLRREIDHRVKNSLASIAAIIALQGRRTTGDEAREALAAVESRLLALSALHDEMHGSDDGQTVDAARLIARAVDKLGALVGERVRFDLALAPVSVPSDHANAIALIVNEFVTNSARHAFADGAGGTISVALRPAAAGYRLACRDDGCGDEAALARIGSSGGLGTRVIGALAASIAARAEWAAASPGLRLSLDAPLAGSLARAI